ncbi:unnamed protein product [Tilletia controversa]|nr:unnamed protein product [Tilletia controversa]
MYENGQLSTKTLVDAMLMTRNVGPWIIFQFGYQGTAHFAIPIIGRTVYAPGVDREQQVNAEGVIALVIAQRLAAASTAAAAMEDERMKSILAKAGTLLASRQRTYTVLNRSEVLGMNYVKALQWHRINPKPVGKKKGRFETEVVKCYRTASEFTTIHYNRSSLPNGNKADGWISPLWDADEVIKFAFRPKAAPQSVIYVGEPISLRRCVGTTNTRHTIFADMLLDEALITQEDALRLTTHSSGTI